MARDHGFHLARITRVIDETPDTRTFVLDAPFSYRAGQFLTFRVGGALRSYSMSSCPATDAALMTTVKRVPGGLVSNWMYDNLAVGDVVEVTLPAGVFCLRETDVPVVAYAGGSGITPVLSLAKNALATTSRRVRILTANRDAESVIFAAALAALAERYPGRLQVRHHIDADSGLVTADGALGFAGEDTGADFYLCGPAPFMDLIERALLSRGVEPGQIFTERFTVADGAGGAAGAGGADAVGVGGTAGAARPAGTGGAAGAGEPARGTITILLYGQRRQVPRRPGETLLESARRAGMSPPFSCEAGNCATCIAHITEGEVKMRVNNALDDDEIEDGWVLTCQSEPVTPDVTVTYDD